MERVAGVFILVTRMGAAVRAGGTNRVWIDATKIVGIEMATPPALSDMRDREEHEHAAMVTFDGGAELMWVVGDSAATLLALANQAKANGEELREKFRRAHGFG